MDQLLFTFLPKHVALTHILPHCEFTQNSCDMKETGGQVKINILYLCWASLKASPGVHFWEYFRIIYHVYFSVCLEKVRENELCLVWWGERPLGSNAWFSSGCGCRLIVWHWACCLSSICKLEELCQNLRVPLALRFCFYTFLS